MQQSPIAAHHNPLSLTIATTCPCHPSNHQHCQHHKTSPITKQTTKKMLGSAKKHLQKQCFSRNFFETNSLLRCLHWHLHQLLCQPLCHQHLTTHMSHQPKKLKAKQWWKWMQTGTWCGVARLATTGSGCLCRQWCQPTTQPLHQLLCIASASPGATWWVSAKVNSNKSDHGQPLGSGQSRQLPLMASRWPWDEKRWQEQVKRPKKAVKAFIGHVHDIRSQVSWKKLKSDGSTVQFYTIWH